MEKYLTIAKEIFENKYRNVGIRSLCADERYEVGDDCRESYEWDFDNDCSTYHTTGATAGGTCATVVDTSDCNFFNYDDEDVASLAANIAQAVEKNNEYGLNTGDQVVIAGNGSYVDGHFDEGEVRILNAWVIAKL